MWNVLEYFNEVLANRYIESPYISRHLNVTIVASSDRALVGQFRMSRSWFWQWMRVTDPGANRGAEVAAGHTIGFDRSNVTICTHYRTVRGAQ